jgi:hypothetical protein
MKSKILIALVLVLVIIQFFRPEKNISNERTSDISSKYLISDSLDAVLNVACNDCHSNRTDYPWYAEVQPIAWWLNGHVTDGKRHLNFSNFTSRPIAIQNHKFEEIVEMVEEEEMPLASYTWFGLHEGADLTAGQREMLITWAKGNMNKLKAEYPADSLVLKRR